MTDCFDGTFLQCVTFIMGKWMDILRDVTSTRVGLGKQDFWPISKCLLLTNSLEGGMYWKSKIKIYTAAFLGSHN